MCNIVNLDVLRDRQIQRIETIKFYETLNYYRVREPMKIVVQFTCFLTLSSVGWRADLKGVFCPCRLWGGGQTSRVFSYLVLCGVEGRPTGFILSLSSVGWRADIQGLFCPCLQAGSELRGVSFAAFFTSDAIFKKELN